MNYVHFVAKPRYPLKHAVQLETTVRFIMTNHFSQMYTCDGTENKWILVSYNGFTNNLVMV